MQETLVITVDFKDPGSYLALKPSLALIDEFRVDHRWLPFLVAPLKAHPAPQADADRGTLHRWQRACYQQQDLMRYAAAQGIAARHFGSERLYRRAEGEVAAMGLNWLNSLAHIEEGVLAGFLERVFSGYWDEALSVDSVEDIAAVLESLGLSGGEYSDYCQTTGPAELVTQRDALIEAGCFSSPTFFFEDDRYLGRQHLPLLRARLSELAA